MKKIFPYIILAILLASVFYVWQLDPKTNENSSGSGDTSLTVNFIFNDGETTTVEYPYNDSAPASVLKITKDIAEEKNWTFIFKQDPDLKIFVDQINTKIGGDNNRYWRYYIDGTQSQVSIDKYFPKISETLTWKFEE